MGREGREALLGAAFQGQPILSHPRMGGSRAWGRSSAMLTPTSLLPDAGGQPVAVGKHRVGERDG